MFFNLFKSKEKEPEIDYSAILVDMHSHILPGIDDGAQNVDESVFLVKKLIALGFKKIVTTPHIMADFYRNTPESIGAAKQILTDKLKQLDIDVRLEAAAEYYLDETFENKLERGGLLTMGDNFLLFELSYINYPQNLFEVIKKVIDKGYKPILAHPERYPYLFGDVSNYRKLKDAGCYLQLNTISLTGYYGKPSQSVAEELVDNYLVDFLGSDMHNPKHAHALKKALYQPYLHRLLTDYQLQNSLLF